MGLLNQESMDDFLETSESLTFPEYLWIFLRRNILLSIGLSKIYNSKKTKTHCSPMEEKVTWEFWEIRQPINPMENWNEWLGRGEGRRDLYAYVHMSKWSLKNCFKNKYERKWKAHRALSIMSCIFLFLLPHYTAQPSQPDLLAAWHLALALNSWHCSA